MSKKNTEKRISYNQYRLADLMIFLLITCACECVNIFALQKWFQGMTFTISVMLLVTLIVLIRWNWFAVIFPVVDGLVYCWMNGAAASQFVIYTIGNAFIILIWFAFFGISKEKIKSKWLLTVLYAVVGFLLMLFGRSLIALFFGQRFGQTFLSMLAAEALNLAFAVGGLLILRLVDGMLVDQKKYLFKVTKERDTIKRTDEYRWDGYTELDENDLRALAAMDEYDKAINFSGRSLKRLRESGGYEECDELKELDGFSESDNNEKDN